MADEASRRRELRRQRILANSESRLRRILSNEEDRVPQGTPTPSLVVDQPEQPPISIVANVTSTNARNLPSSRANDSDRVSPKPTEINVGRNGKTQQLSGKATERTPTIGPPPSADRERVQSNYHNPIANLNFADIPTDELQLLGGDILAAGRTQMEANFGRTPPGKFDCSPLAQLISSLATTDEASIVTLANLAGRLGLPEADQVDAGRTTGHRGVAMNRRGASEAARRRYQPLWDPCHLHRIFFILLLAILARLVLPVLPSDYAVMFAPLYLMEVISISMCILFAVPLDRSRMSFAFSLLLFLGASPKSVRFGHTLTAFFELLFRDMSTYAFGFFITHALCQHTGELLAITTK